MANRHGNEGCKTLVGERLELEQVRLVQCEIEVIADGDQLVIADFELLNTEPTRSIPDGVLIGMDLHKRGGNQFWHTPRATHRVPQVLIMLAMSSPPLRDYRAVEKYSALLSFSAARARVDGAP